MPNWFDPSTSHTSAKPSILTISFVLLARDQIGINDLPRDGDNFFFCQLPFCNAHPDRTLVVFTLPDRSFHNFIDKNQEILEFCLNKEQRAIDLQAQNLWKS